MVSPETLLRVWRGSEVLSIVLCEQSKCNRKKKRRCTDCELKERLTEDVDRYWKMYKIDWGNTEQDFVRARPEKLTFNDLNEKDLEKFEKEKIEVYEEGRSKRLTKEYSTAKGVGRDVKSQGKSQKWHQDGQSAST